MIRQHMKNSKNVHMNVVEIQIVEVYKKPAGVTVKESTIP